MPILSSSRVTDQHAQPGGGRWTVETHIDSDGNSYTVGPYLWDGVVDRDALMASRAAALAETLAAAELERLLDD